MESAAAPAAKWRIENIGRSPCSTFRQTGKTGTEAELERSVCPPFAVLSRDFAPPCTMRIRRDGGVGVVLVEHLAQRLGRIEALDQGRAGAVRAGLEGRGVKFDGETVTYSGLVMLATFFDPDGNKLNAFCMVEKE